jgi:hemerythrin
MPSAWNDSLKIGIPLIDQQHKQLIDQMGVLVDAMQTNTAQSKLIETLNFLDKYVDEHFSYEESCMWKYQCPVAQENQINHQHFITTLKSIRQQIETSGVSLSVILQVNDKLLQWFINHIRKIDTQLKVPNNP